MKTIVICSPDSKIVIHPPSKGGKTQPSMQLITKPNTYSANKQDNKQLTTDLYPVTCLISPTIYPVSKLLSQAVSKTFR